MTLIESPYRKLLEPLATYIRTVERKHLEKPIVMVKARWYHYVLHNR